MNKVVWQYVVYSMKIFVLDPYVHRRCLRLKMMLVNVDLNHQLNVLVTMHLTMMMYDEMNQYIDYYDHLNSQHRQVVHHRSEEMLLVLKFGLSLVESVFCFLFFFIIRGMLVKKNFWQVKKTINIFIYVCITERDREREKEVYKSTNNNWRII